jgi:DNA-binding transcriptional ArsR family regulator
MKAETERRFARLLDKDAIRALSNPMRVAIFQEAVHRPVSAKEISDMLEEPLPKVSYHVRALADANLLKPVRRTRRRGAIETHYRAAADLEISEKVWEDLPDAVRETLLDSLLTQLADDVGEAVHAGAHRQRDFTLLRGHFFVTDEARTRLEDEVRDFYGRLQAIEREFGTREDGPDRTEMNIAVATYEGRRRVGRNRSVAVGREDVGRLPLLGEER